MQDDSLENLNETVGVSEHAGFPNAALDSSLTTLDLGRLLIRRPLSTFFMRLRGSTWEDQGIFDGDIAIIDRALLARQTDTVIWWQEEDFNISSRSKVPQGIPIWGVVTNIIHQLRP